MRETKAKKTGQFLICMGMEIKDAEGGGRKGRGGGGGGGTVEGEIVGRGGDINTFTTRHQHRWLMAWIKSDYVIMPRSRNLT